ncbi:MAG: tetratricopeptide repeat protein, partial [Actinomycetota bacterium]|nr:tetratricopeptide repeat protein [Actinomycetota bacterium]
MSAHNVIDVTEGTFEADVLRRSFETTVVVDFWAEWCGPCRALGPILERLASEEGADWVLAKLDVEANQRIAAAFGIQGIPAVKAFRDGKQVGEFTGALPESQVRRWLEGLGPSEGELAIVVAEEAEKEGRFEEARDAYEQALKAEPGLYAARSGLARVDLALRVRDIDVIALGGRSDMDPSDVEQALGLADLAAADGRHEEAFGILVETIRHTNGDDRERVRKHLLG